MASICDLAPHDLSILLYWLDDPVASVAAAGRSVFQPDVPETAFLTVTFETGATANVQLSWLSPRKIRDMTIVGSRRMVQYDDTGADEAIRVFDRGMDFVHPTTFGEHQLTYRSGDIVIPRLEAAEPLGQELADFAERGLHRRQAALARPAGPGGRARHGGRRGLAAGRWAPCRGLAPGPARRRLTSTHFTEPYPMPASSGHRPF